MAAFEYKEVQCKYATENAATFTKLGSEGWQFIQMIPVNQNWVAYFEREIEKHELLKLKTPEQQNDGAHIS